MISKGQKSRVDLLEQARELLNTEGHALTIAELAGKLNMTSGKITYHFPTKDHLFLALAARYEEKQRERREQSLSRPSGFTGFVQSSSMAMDIQYDYRCVIRHLATSVRSQGELFSHLTDTFRNNRKIIRSLFGQLVEQKLLKPTILEDNNFQVFLFQFTSLFSTWVINLEIYDTDRTYVDMKPIYLKGIFSCFIPYLTAKGKKELEGTLGHL